MVRRIRVQVEINTTTAARLLADNGIEPPSIPPGSNTATQEFTTPDGRTGIVIAQTGFDPPPFAPAWDPNGLSVVMAESAGTAVMASLRAFVDRMLGASGDTLELWALEYLPSGSEEVELGVYLAKESRRMPRGDARDENGSAG